MRIVFNLEYQTTFGEELMLNILAEGKTEKLVMGTLDGLHWMCELSKTVKAANVSTTSTVWYAEKSRHVRSG